VTEKDICMCLFETTNKTVQNISIKMPMSIINETIENNVGPE
jgi:hypothetical protein